MKNLLTILAAIFALSAHAQGPPNAYFQDSSLAPCPFDSTQMILTPDHWFAYQTLDDRWDGVMDSTRCITFKDTLSMLIIELDQIDISKPIFVKSLMDDSTKVLLDSNWLFQANAVMFLNNNTFANFSQNCENDICTGVTFMIEVPDSSGTSTNLRTYSIGANGATHESYEACLPTEYFSKNYLKEVIFKFSLLGLESEDRWIAPRSTYLEPSYFFSTVQEDYFIPASWSQNDSIHDLNISTISDYYAGESHLLMYTDMTYPDEDHWSYLELGLEENMEAPHTFNLFVDEWQSLIFQPFSFFRGALVEGSDSIRHHFNLVNNGGDLCLFFIDVTFNEIHNNYVHQGGTVSFESSTSCMQFSRGSALIVADNTEFHYGQNGKGMLALREGGTIKIGKNSTLLIDNSVLIHENKDVAESHQIFMELNPTSSLIFGENASLSNRFSRNKAMKLNIYMNGGTLDDSQLSPEERAIINRIYPTPPTHFADNVKIFPNPTKEAISYSLILEKEEVVELSVYDIAGRFVFSNQKNGKKGWNEFQIELPNLEAGVYFFKIKTKAGLVTKKIIIL